MLLGIQIEMQLIYLFLTGLENVKNHPFWNTALDETSPPPTNVQLITNKGPGFLAVLCFGSYPTFSNPLPSASSTGDTQKG
jgi:hypothetical protein